MPARLLRPLLIIEFMIALQVVFTCWSQIGGQYHLDVMFWPWKLVLSAAMALLTTALTASLVRSDGIVGKKTWIYGSLLLATIAIAGLVTYYYHLHEPSDEDDQDDQPATITRSYFPLAGSDLHLNNDRPVFVLQLRFHNPALIPRERSPEVMPAIFLPRKIERESATGQPVWVCDTKIAFKQKLHFFPVTFSGKST